MKKILFFAFAVLLPYYASAASASNASKPVSKARYAPGEIIIKYKKPPSGGSQGGNAGAQAVVVPDQAESVQALHRKHGMKNAENVFKRKSAAQKGALKAKAEKNRKRAAKENPQKVQEMEEGFQRTYKLKFDEGADIEKILQDYRNDPNVEYAEPNYIIQLEPNPDKK